MALLGSMLVIDLQRWIIFIYGQTNYLRTLILKFWLHFCIFKMHTKELLLEKTPPQDFIICDIYEKLKSKITIYLNFNIIISFYWYLPPNQWTSNSCQLSSKAWSKRKWSKRSYRLFFWFNGTSHYTVLLTELTITPIRHISIGLIIVRIYWSSVNFSQSEKKRIF